MRKVRPDILEGGTDARQKNTWLNSILYFPLHQPFEEIETVGIALQSDYPPSRPIAEAQFFGNQQPPVSGDAFDARSDTAFGLQRDDLIHVKPVLVIQAFQIFVKACANETSIQVGERGQDSSKELLEGKGRRRLQCV